MAKFRLLLPLLIISILIATVFFRFFDVNPIGAGDYVPLEPINIQYWLINSFHTWQSQSGLGGDVSYISAYAPVATLLALLSFLTGYNIFVFEKILNFGLFLGIGVFSIAILYRKVFPESKYWYLSPLIYLLNTYVLMIVGGGQIVGIFQAYTILPFALFIYLRVRDALSRDGIIIFKIALQLGLILSLITMLDVRVGYIAAISLLFLTIINCLSSLKKQSGKVKVIRKSLFVLFFAILIVCLTHLYWLLPTLLNQTSSALPQNFASNEMIDFLSFTRLENTISLLHPNWPENIFGKVNFFNPLFLIFPILAFSSILVIRNTKAIRHNALVISLALAALLAAFLAKGTAEPFGEIYLFFSNFIPGFTMLRDSTKWYMVIAVCYSLLIPFTLSQLILLKRISRFEKYFELIIPLLFILIFGLTILPALMGQLTGAFKNSPKPHEYQKLSDELASDPVFSRSLWIPERKKFAPFSMNHPVISGRNLVLLNDLDNIASLVESEKFSEILSLYAVKYVILPVKTDKEIFSDEELFSLKSYDSVLKRLDMADFLIKNSNFKSLNVYEFKDYSKRFWSLRSDLVAEYYQISPTNYRVEIKDAIEEDVIFFSEQYSSGWKMKVSQADQAISSMEYKEINSFVVNKVGSYTVEISYENQVNAWIGLIVGLVVCMVLVFALIRNRKFG